MTPFTPSSRSQRTSLTSPCCLRVCAWSYMALLLNSAGKSAAIAAMLTSRNALSDVPGELQLNEVLLAESCFQRCGTVHEISCCAQDADCPPATAAVCPAVGSGGSASPSSPEEEGAEGEP